MDGLLCLLWQLMKEAFRQLERLRAGALQPVARDVEEPDRCTGLVYLLGHGLLAILRAERGRDVYYGDRAE